MTRKLIVAVFVVMLAMLARAADNGSCPVRYNARQTHWADSVFQTLDTRKKIAQLIMLAVYSNKDESYNKRMVDLFERLQLGGIIFMQGGPVRQAVLCNKIEARLNIPAMIAIDAEYGLGMRLDSTIYYPRAIAMAAMRDKSLIYDYGKEIGRQCRRLGININFAPVLDVNIEPENPIISSRSYGDDKNTVIECATMYASGLQTCNVLAVGKHFPGHGDTHTDSHLALPVVEHNANRLDDIELYPFRKTADLLGGMLVAHLAIPALEPDSLLPSTLSKRIIDSLLIKDIGYKGLIFTDALNMRGVSNAFEPGDLEVKALAAGNDILLFPKNAELAIDKIEQAIADSIISIDEIDRKCRKVLLAKAWMGLDNYSAIDTANLYADLHATSAQNLLTSLTENSITVLKGSNHLPIKDIFNNRILSVCIGGSQTNTFQQTLMAYAPVDTIWTPTYPTDSAIASIFDTAISYNTIIISTIGTNELQSKNFGLIPETQKLIDTLATNGRCILAHLGNPYALRRLRNADQLRTILIGYRSTSLTQSVTAQAIMGGIGISGRIAINIGTIKTDKTLTDTKPSRLKISDIETEGLDNRYFDKIDSIVDWCINNRVMPGCQLLLAANGRIIYHKAYGHHTYDSTMPVQLTDLYDIASVTKVVATTTALMQLADQKKFKPSDKLSKYVPMLKKTDKKDLQINKIMAHQAGLKSWIPYYKSTLAGGRLRDDLYAKEKSDKYGIQLGDSLFLLTTYTDSMYQTIAESQVGKPQYLYSDIGFQLFPLMIKRLSKQDINEYCQQHIFGPLGMNMTCYKPLQRFDKQQIVPSEIDRRWRGDTVHGFVNDQAAAMLDGVSGHAGLFSNANDLAKICQMWLNGGTYGGQQLIKKRTLNTFTSASFEREGNRRALGFDKPAKPGDEGPTCKLASAKSFGHSGFTGAYIWVDPEKDCFMVFVTNRTFPSSNNNRLARLNIRTQIQELFYEALNSKASN